MGPTASKPTAVVVHPTKPVEEEKKVNEGRSLDELRAIHCTFLYVQGLVLSLSFTPVAHSFACLACVTSHMSLDNEMADIPRILFAEKLGCKPEQLVAWHLMPRIVAADARSRIATKMAEVHRKIKRDDIRQALEKRVASLFAGEPATLAFACVAKHAVDGAAVTWNSLNLFRAVFVQLPPELTTDLELLTDAAHAITIALFEVLRDAVMVELKSR